MFYENQAFHQYIERACSQSQQTDIKQKGTVGNQIKTLRGARRASIAVAVKSVFYIIRSIHDVVRIKTQLLNQLTSVVGNRILL